MVLYQLRLYEESRQNKSCPNTMPPQKEAKNLINKKEKYPILSQSTSKMDKGRRSLQVLLTAAAKVRFMYGNLCKQRHSCNLSMCPRL